jgi:DNA polymerase III gamma/tau subunit
MSLHNNYRPVNLDRIIGHEAHVTRMKGIVASGKHPNAIALFGPTSAGKTTLVRAFAADINDLKTITGSRDYMEMNGSSEKSIDDIRQVQQLAKFKPQNKVRIICIDEAHGLLSNPQAANALLKVLETPPKNTMFAIASMEASKFQSSQVGRAILNRCNQFVLEPHTPEDLLKQAKRIAKGENMKYVLDEEGKILKAVVKNAQEMRSLANLMESLQQYHEGLTKKPKLLDKEHIATVLKSTESSDDKLAVQVMLGVYGCQFKVVQRSLLDIQDGFQFVKKLMWLNQYAMNTTVLDGARHPKVWGSAGGKEVLAATKGKITMGMMAAVNASMVETVGILQQFATSPEELLSARLYRLIKELDPMRPKEK